MIADLRLGTRLVLGLPGLLGRPIGAAEARATVRARLARRDADFLGLMQQAVYERPGSPYRALLAHAGCERGDLERLVRTEGLEAALAALARQGVYLTVDELKGRRPVSRGTLRLALTPEQLWNPGRGPHLLGQSSGSRGPRIPVPIDVASIRELAVDLRVFLDALGGQDVEHGVWMVPGGWPLDNLLRFRACGIHPARWFSQVDPRAAGLHPRYRWSIRVVRWAARLASGRALPAPAYAPVDDPTPVVRWMASALARGRTPHLWTLASSAVRACQAAAALGLRLEGARFTVSGEPVTDTRLAVIRATGAMAVPRYGSIECGQIGLGCLAPVASDDVHVLADLHAVIPAPAVGAGPPGTLLFSSIRPTARMILVNASLGDQARVEARRCGCPLDAVGWTTHLRQIRSHEKVVAGGMATLHGELVRILEEVLPARFGGAPTHYQLVEEEAADGRPRLCLRVHPAVGPVDAVALVQAFLEAVGRGAGIERLRALSWQAGDVVRVERSPPETTATGKILHRHRHVTGGPPGPEPRGLGD